MKSFLLCNSFFWMAVATVLLAPAVFAVDFESFEFADPAGTPLAAAANTANPGNNWTEDADMTPSDVRSGTYNIVKQSATLDTNYLQVDNITSGTRYLVATMSGWDFYQFDPSDPGEEFRLAFLDNDTGNSGATITAQMNIRRDPGGSGNMILEATALGNEFNTNIPRTAALNTTQSNPFTMVLELNKDSNSYKVFYKDGTNPTQVLGLGTVDSARSGNSIRMAVNNDFGTFTNNYPDEFFEIFSVDRIAVTDVNPLSDLISLEVSRTGSTVTLRNTSGATISGIESYSITSESGALNPAGWNSGSATPTTSTNMELAATFAAPINLANGQTLSLSTGAGPWIKSPIEDLQMVLNLSGGGTRTVDVDFLGNGGFKWPVADFNLNNMVDANDWLTFIAAAETNLDGLSRVEAYSAGDLDGDGVNSISDFVEFKRLYDADNGGPGAFEEMLAGLTVPEPGGLLLLTTAAALLSLRRRRRPAVAVRSANSSSIDATVESFPAGVVLMPNAPKLFSPLIATMAIFAVTSTAWAVNIEDFPFNDDDSTVLQDAANVINPANTFLVDEDMSNSFVQGGVFHVRKDNENNAPSVADITSNITSGKGWIVAEIDGWRFNSEETTGNFNPTSPERFRITFLDNDSGLSSGSSFVTAEARIQRTTTGSLELFGTALGGGGNITGPQPTLNLNQTEPFTLILELDEDADQYSIFYMSASDSNFSQFGGPTAISSTRSGNAMRVMFDGNFSGIDMATNQEFFDLDRVYVTTTNPLTGPIVPTTLTLEVKSNGQVAIKNTTDSAITFNSYRIGFTDPLVDDLNFGGWDSLSNKGIDAVMGGDDPGETWDEAGGSNDTVLAESFLLGSSTIPATTGSLPLGSAFKPGGDHSLLTFEYYDVNAGSIVLGAIDFVEVTTLDGDYNDDGAVNAADYVVWRKNPAANGGPQGYSTWRTNFGQSAGAGAAVQEQTAVPEPAAFQPLIAGLCAILAYKSPRNSPFKFEALLRCRSRLGEMANSHLDLD